MFCMEVGIGAVESRGLPHLQAFHCPPPTFPTLPQVQLKEVALNTQEVIRQRAELAEQLQVARGAVEAERQGREAAERDLEAMRRWDRGCTLLEWGPVGSVSVICIWGRQGGGRC